MLGIDLLHRYEANGKHASERKTSRLAVIGVICHPLLGITDRQLKFGAGLGVVGVEGESQYRG
jgi:hypothetical protein